MSNFKPFDLEKWRAGDKIQFRDGRPVHEIFFSAHRNELGRMSILSVDDEGNIRCHHENGIFNILMAESALDLVMAPKKVKYWFASWATRTDQFFGPKRYATDLYSSKEIMMNALDAFSWENAIIHEIEIEE